jgi:hypothetical protein
MSDSPPPSWVHRDKMSGLHCAPYIGQPDPEKKTTTNFKSSECKPTLAERRGQMWLRKLSLSTQILGKTFRPIFLSDGSDIEEITKEEYLRCKPLPALPGLSFEDRDPYFEYLFADAEVTKKLDDDLNSPIELESDFPSEQVVFLSVRSCILLTWLAQD